MSVSVTVLPPQTVSSGLTDFFFTFSNGVVLSLPPQTSQWINALNVNYSRRTKQLTKPMQPVWFGLDSANVRHSWRRACIYCEGHVDEVKGLLMKWTVCWWSEGCADKLKGLLMKWRACWWSERSVDEVTGLLMKWTVCCWNEGPADKVKGLLMKWWACWWSESLHRARDFVSVRVPAELLELRCSATQELSVMLDLDCHVLVLVLVDF
jgi:hypothetical protein